MTEVNPIVVQTLAKMTGKTEEEVLKFLEKTKEVPSAPKIDITTTDAPAPIVKETPQEVIVTSKVPEPKVVQDEVITEEVPLDQVSQEQLEEIGPEDTFSSTIRPGSKVRIVWEPNVGKGKIKWTGRVGTVLQKLSDSGISIYEVEFPSGKIPFQRVNKETGKLQKGYYTKKLKTWFDEANIELVF